MAMGDGLWINGIDEYNLIDIYCGSPADLHVTFCPEDPYYQNNRTISNTYNTLYVQTFKIAEHY